LQRVLPPLRCRYVLRKRFTRFMKTQTGPGAASFAANMTMKSSWRIGRARRPPGRIIPPRQAVSPNPIQPHPRRPPSSVNLQVLQSNQIPPRSEHPHWILSFDTLRTNLLAKHSVFDTKYLQGRGKYPHRKTGPETQAQAQGIVYIVKSVQDNTVLLVSENGETIRRVHLDFMSFSDLEPLTTEKVIS